MTGRTLTLAVAAAVVSCGRHGTTPAATPPARYQVRFETSAGAFVVEARVEVNPVSREQLLRTREFIANPAAGSRAGGASRSVLGAMASFLLREPDAGSDVHVFRSRVLGRGDVREVRAR